MRNDERVLGDRPETITQMPDLEEVLAGWQARDLDNTRRRVCIDVLVLAGELFEATIVTKRTESEVVTRELSAEAQEQADNRIRHFRNELLNIQSALWDILGDDVLSGVDE
jgi:hypothetical protein